MISKKKLAKTVIFLTLPAILWAPKKSSSFSFDSTVELVLQESPVISNFTNYTSDVMLSDLDPSFLSYDELLSDFKNLPLADTLSIGYLPIASLSKQDSLVKQAYNRFRAVQKDGDTFYSDLKELKWTNLAPLLGMKKGPLATGSDVHAEFFDKFGDDVLKVAKKYNFPVNDFVSLLLGESALNQFALSNTYCPGFGQLYSGVAYPDSPVNHFYSLGIPKKINTINGHESIDRSGMHYASLLRSLKNNRDLSLTAYNAGFSKLDTAIAHSQSDDLDSILASQKMSTKTNSPEFVLSSQARNYAKHIREHDGLADFYVDTYLNKDPVLLVSN